MIELVGNLSLGLGVLAVALAGMAAVAAAKFESDALLKGARTLVGVYLALITLASVALLAALLNNDFSIQYVVSYSERALPFGFKLAAFWAGQAGSLLLWALLLAAFSFLYVMTRKHGSHREAAGAIVTLAIINAFFVSLMLFAERPATDTAPATHANPFSLAEVVPADGRGLNPMLQDWAMIAHPPALFLGYAGFAVPFAMLIGALVAGRRDNEWIAATRRWTLVSWLFLSIGIILGAEWAYVELGWGGYWAWDPVENASLLPWLTATALLHSIMAQQARGMLKLWNAVLIALTFILCIFGTYITRSGVIDSVHSFGQSIIGTFFLMFLIVLTLATVAIIVVQRSLLKSENPLESLTGREGMFLATNILLVAMTVATTVGTMFPIISRLFSGNQVTPTTSFYNRTVAPLGLVLVAMMALGPVLGYGKDAGRRLGKALVVPAAIAVLAVIAFAMKGVVNAWALACVAICTVVLSNVLISLSRAMLHRIREDGENPVTALVRLLDGNHRRYGGQIVHLGVMLMVAGITASSLFSNKQSFQMSPGQSVQFGGMTMTLMELRETRNVNFTAVEAVVKLVDAKGEENVLHPQRRFYDKAEEANSEVAIQTGWKQDVYLTLAGWEDGGKVTAIETIINPLVSWIWVGGIVLTIGTIFSLLPRMLPAARQGEVKESAPVVAGRPAPAA